MRSVLRRCKKRLKILKRQSEDVMITHPQQLQSEDVMITHPQQLQSEEVMITHPQQYYNVLY
jgi:hypothetical protein